MKPKANHPWRWRPRAKRKRKQVGSRIRTDRIRKPSKKTEAYRFRRILQKRKRRAALRGQLCDCCKAAQFLAVYRAAKVLAAEVDHRVPLALGGLHCIQNLQILSKHEHALKTKEDLRLISQVQRGSMALSEAVAYLNRRIIGTP